MLRRQLRLPRSAPTRRRPPLRKLQEHSKEREIAAKPRRLQASAGRRVRKREGEANENAIFDSPAGTSFCRGPFVSNDRDAADGASNQRTENFLLAIRSGARSGGRRAFGGSCATRTVARSE